MIDAKTNGESNADRKTLREWYAGQALAGFDLSGQDFGTIGKPTSPWPWIAEQCVAAADAMLAELAKPQPEGVQ